MSRPDTLHPDLTDTERQQRVIETLEAIRADEGPLWSLYASAFCHGSAVREWRLDLVDELERRLS